MTAIKFKNVYEALAHAQGLFGPVIKGSKNPHFNSRYADLADLMATATPTLSACGLCLWFKIDYSDNHSYMVATLTHGESETHIECKVPLIVNKNDMQGFKSATTYAKRIGAESVTGIAPEDDDGNAASSKPVQPVQTVKAVQSAKQPSGFDPKNNDHLKAINVALESLGVKGLWRAHVINAMAGKSMTELSSVIEMCNPESPDLPKEK